MKLLATKMHKSVESEIARLEELAVKTEAARDAVAEELEVLRQDAAALRGAVDILLRVDRDQVCSECGNPSGARRTCDSCRTSREQLETRARLRVA